MVEILISMYLHVHIYLRIQYYDNYCSPLMLPSQGLRAQIDRDQYRRNMQEEIRGTRGLHVREDSVEDLVIEGDKDGTLPEVVGACLGIVAIYSFRCSDQHIKCCTYSQLQLIFGQIVTPQN